MWPDYALELAAQPSHGKSLPGAGNGLHNELVGNGGANLLQGLADIDTLDGGEGADKINGGGGSDVFVFPSLTDTFGLVLLEALADFGAVSILGVETLTTAVYKTWFGLYSLPAAAQLALGVVGVVVLLLVLERLGRGRGRHAYPARRTARPCASARPPGRAG